MIDGKLYPKSNKKISNDESKIQEQQVYQNNREERKRN